MLDFTSVRARERSIGELADGLSTDDLRQLTNGMIDAIGELIAECTDADVVFVPDDPKAYDPAASSAEDVELSWTLGHVIVHTTASAEESAALAAELARGVTPRKIRSRSEIPWETVTTLDQCLHRLEESRRMRLASLDMWPDEPYLDNALVVKSDGPHYATEGRPAINCVSRFILGLLHDDSHLGQIARIVAQARAAQEGVAPGA